METKEKMAEEVGRKKEEKRSPLCLSHKVIKKN